MSVLEYVNVSRSFRQVPVLDGVSFSVGEGEVVRLVGPQRCRQDNAATFDEILKGLTRIAIKEIPL